MQFSDWTFSSHALRFEASEQAQCPSCSDATAQVYALTKEEGGRHTPFFSNYKPQFFFRTADITGGSQHRLAVKSPPPSEGGWQAASVLWQDCPVGCSCGMGLCRNRLPCSLCMHVSSLCLPLISRLAQCLSCWYACEDTQKWAAELHWRAVPSGMPCLQ